MFSVVTLLVVVNCFLSFKGAKAKKLRKLSTIEGKVGGRKKIQQDDDENKIKQQLICFILLNAFILKEKKNLFAHKVYKINLYDLSSNNNKTYRYFPFLL